MDHKTLEEISQRHLENKESLNSLSKEYGVSYGKLKNQLRKNGYKTLSIKELTYKKIPYETLYSLYVKENKMLSDLSRELGHSKKHIKSELSRHKIPLKSKKENDELTSKRIQESKREKHGTSNLWEIPEYREKFIESMKKSGEENKTELPIEKIRHLYKDKGYSQQKISKIYNVAQSTIGLFLNEHGVETNDKRFSSAEREILDFIKDTLEIQSVETNTKEIIPPLELDLYFPEYNFAIEYNGVYWHSDLYKLPKYHQEKKERCERKGIDLFHIYENDFLQNPDLILSMIENRFGLSKKIYARNCRIRLLENEEERKFLKENHLQGFIGSSIAYGLFHNKELVSLMSFGNPRFNKNYQWELLRFCNKRGVSVIGGASKIFRKFERKCKPKDIISYANYDYSSGKLYEKLDFEYSGKTKPNYFYVNTKTWQVVTRYKAQKHRLKDLLGKGFDEHLTESQNMLNNGYLKIYNSGNLVYKKLFA